MTRVGVVLCGCGRFDGSEIHESVLTLLHLTRAGVEIRCFAPNRDQWATCDGFGGLPVPEPPRSMLTEAARIARGEIEPLSEAHAEELDALILPGGSGLTRNLCDFALQGGNGSVLPELAVLIRTMHAARKPIGALCIAPILLALALGEFRPRLTLGGLEGVAQEAALAGADMVECPVEGVVVDSKNRLVTTPAYMLGPGIAQVDAGISRLVDEVIALLSVAVA